MSLRARGCVFVVWRSLILPLWPLKDGRPWSEAVFLVEFAGVMAMSSACPAACLSDFFCVSNLTGWRVGSLLLAGTNSTAFLSYVALCRISTSGEFALVDPPVVSESTSSRRLKMSKFWHFLGRFLSEASLDQAPIRKRAYQQTSMTFLSASHSHPNPIG